MNAGSRPPTPISYTKQAESDDFIEEFNHPKVNPSTSLAGNAVGVKEVEPGIWLVSSLVYPSAHFHRSG